MRYFLVTLFFPLFLECSAETILTNKELVSREACLFNTRDLKYQITNEMRHPEITMLSGHDVHL